MLTAIYQPSVNKTPSNWRSVYIGLVNPTFATIPASKSVYEYSDGAAFSFDTSFMTWPNQIKWIDTNPSYCFKVEMPPQTGTQKLKFLHTDCFSSLIHICQFDCNNIGKQIIT